MELHRVRIRAACCIGAAAAALALSRGAFAAVDFVSRTDQSAGFNGPAAVVADDFFNADGVLDIAVSFGGGTNRVVIYENVAGAGTFTSRTVITAGMPASAVSEVGTDPSGLVARDLDADTFVDLIGVNRGTNRFFAYRNPAGVPGAMWTPLDMTADRGRGFDLAVAQWNPAVDTAWDLITCTETGGIGLALGDAPGGMPNGMFFTVSTFTVANGGVLSDVEVANFARITDSVATPDILTVSATAGDGKLIVWPGQDSVPGNVLTGQEIIIPTMAPSGLVTPFEAFVDDWDGDGNPDALVATTEGWVLHYRGTGTGTVFAAPTSTDLVSARAPERLPTNLTSMTYADLDGDGLRDLVLADEGDPNTTTGFNWMSAYFGCTDAPAAPTFDVDGATCGKPPLHHAAANLARLKPFGVVAAQLDGAGGVDVLLLNGDAQSFTLYRNDGSPSFDAARSYAAGGRRPRGAAELDLDGDGAHDIVTSLFASQTAAVLRADGMGGFERGAQLAPPSVAGAHAISIAPLDAGDVPDVLCTATADHVLWPGNGDGTAAAPRILPGLGGEHRVGDLGGSAALDLAVVANRAGLEFVARVMRGAGDGTFTEFQRQTGIYSYADHVVGDFFAGAAHDIVIAGKVSDALNPPSVLFVMAYDGATGRHGAATQVGLPMNVEVARLAAGDFDRSGTLDVIGLTPAGQALTFLNVTGTQLMPHDNAVTPAFSMGPSPRSVVATDVSCDGVLDLVAASADRITVREGLGDGRFGPAVSLNGNLDNDSVVVGDWNADASRDVAVTSTDTNDVTVFLSRCIAPLRIIGTNLPGGGARFDWNAQGVGASYHVNRGNVATMIGNRDTRDAACLPPDPQLMPQFTDTDPLPPIANGYAAYYYLVACEGPQCSAPGLGVDSAGRPRVAGPGACL
jgi:hypothetical protein